MKKFKFNSVYFILAALLLVFTSGTFISCSDDNQEIIAPEDSSLIQTTENPGDVLQGSIVDVLNSRSTNIARLTSWTVSISASN